MGHPVNVLIQRTMHLSSMFPANDTRESMFGHRKSQVDFAAVDDVVICWWSIYSLCNSQSISRSYNRGDQRYFGLGHVRHMAIFSR